MMNDIEIDDEISTKIISFVYLKAGFLRTRWHPETPNLIPQMRKHIMWCLETRDWYKNKSVGSISATAVDDMLTDVVLSELPSPIHPSRDCEELKLWATENNFYNYVLIPNIENCRMCKTKLRLNYDSECYVYDDNHPGDLGARGIAYKKTCDCKWNFKYYIGCCEYSDPSTFQKYFFRYNYADSERFWFSSSETYLATKTLSRALHEQYHAHSGVSTVADAWNNFHNNKVKPKRGWIIEVFNSAVDTVSFLCVSFMRHLNKATCEYMNTIPQKKRLELLKKKNLSHEYTSIGTGWVLLY